MMKSGRFSTGKRGVPRFSPISSITHAPRPSKAATVWHHPQVGQCKQGGDLPGVLGEEPHLGKTQLPHRFHLFSRKHDKGATFSNHTA